jgi:phosphate transport system substrate-binding protein
MSGTGTALGMMERLGAAYARTQAGSRVEVLPNLGSSGAVQAVARGAIDLAVSGRALTAEERALGLASFEIARTPFVFAVGPGAGVRGITTADLVRILRGELLAWPGGERVRLIVRPASDADTQVVRDFSPEVSAALDVALARPGLVVAVTNQECNEAIERTQGAIGGTTLLQLRTETRTLGVLAWNGVEPTVAAMRAGAYPLAKPLYAVIRRAPEPRVRRWLAFLASAQARRLLEQLGASATPFPSP